jgi:uncharacterized protein (DUF1800 family)
MGRLKTKFWIAPLLVLPLASATAPVTISPTQTSTRGGSKRQFSAALHGVAGPITWLVNGIAGGNAAVGTISSTGLFAASTTNPGGALTVRASAGPVFADAAVTWLNPEPSITALVPAAVNVGSFNITLNGKNFVAGSTVLLNGTAAPTSFVSSTSLSFQSTINAPGAVSVTVGNPQPGASTSSARTLEVMPPVSISMASKTSVRLASTHKFYASVKNALDKTVAWSVNGVPGGGATTGTIAADGTYTAPSAMPPGDQVTIGAAAVAQPSAAAQETVTLLNPTPVLQSASPNPITYGPLTITVNGTGFVSGSQIKLGNAALTTQFVSPTQLTATGTVNPTPGGLLAFHVSNPSPGGGTSGLLVIPAGTGSPKVSYLAAARFLEQASWGPDAAGIAHVQAVGFDAWLDEQLAAPVSIYKASNSSSNGLVNQQSEFFVHAMQGQDQLRQRVAFALSEIFVVSGLKTGEPRQMVPYLNMLAQDAFGTYLNVLRDVTLSPTMGVYLDMVNNDKGDPTAGTAPNENYGREVMQLLSLGTVLLNSDGSVQKNAGQPIPTYDQTTITNMAHALTGWTFPGKTITHGHNPENYSGPMIAVEANHDETQKTIVGGTVLPAGQSAQQDLDAVLQTLATHPNAAPFISLRLIEHLVTSNPSPGYISRISQVFTSTQGDLSQVVRAILLDPEARQGDDPQNAPIANGGHLREPVLFVLAMMRNLGASVVDQNPIEALAASMGQNLLYPGSVFSYYSPLYRISGGVQAPEFQLLTSATALVRANVVQDLVARNLDGDIHYDLSPFTALASSPSDLVDAVNNTFLYGRLPASLKPDIVAAITAASGTDRVRNAIYLVATSALYQVEH